MRDRIPTHAGRIKLTPVDASNGIYDMERADAPVEEGTPINKSTLLTDETAVGLGVEQNDPTVNDAFSRIITAFSEVYGEIDSLVFPQIETGSYIGTGDYDDDTEEAYKNSLTFSFVPKLWGIYAIQGASFTSGHAGKVYMFPWKRRDDTEGVQRYSVITPDSFDGTIEEKTLYVTTSGNTVTWYSTTSANHQLNRSSYRYFYFAIG